MSNNGTSAKFTITGEKLKASNYLGFNRFRLDGMVNPPSIDKGGYVAISKWINPWPEIAFAKIAYPRWDGICQYNAMISNNPDFIKDYHFISLMRLTDYYLAPSYVANIRVKVTSPSFYNSNANR